MGRKWAAHAAEPRRVVTVKTRQSLYDQIEARAVAGNRSLSAEYELLLMKALEPAPDLRTLIREEIRAALAERDDTVPGETWTKQFEHVYRY